MLRQLATEWLTLGENRFAESVSNTMATKNPHLHPTLMRRVGDAAATVLLAGALAVIWGSIGVVVVAAIFG
jgi:hypothetical protein